MSRTCNPPAWTGLICPGILLTAFAGLLLSGATAARQDDQKQREQAAAEEVERLLAKLDEQQNAGLAGQDVWAETMKKLIELGPDAVPALSQALSETPIEQRLMLRSIPFILRGIGDPRAVPALIQTLPKCNWKDGSGMGYNSENPELLAFMRKHDADLKDRSPKHYGWGRPITEVRTALKALTDTQHGEMELIFLHGRSGNRRQQHLTEVLYLRCAERWATWWKDNWQNFTDDERFATVELPETETSDKLFELDRDALLVIDNRIGNLLCEPVQTGTGRVFYDLDTGRYGGVHERWKDPASRTDVEIVSKWAVSQGFDLMGSQVEVDGKTVFVLRLISGEAWWIPSGHWDHTAARTAFEVIEQGTAVDGILALPTEDGSEPDYRNTELYFVITRHGTPAFVRQGVDVHDTNVVIGTPLRGDENLNPIHFWMGRRFGLRTLKEE